ncbi:Mitochondrial processing peptidase-like protein [hydrothermal vent metagenome]|uniref:Mitochondrial processing peptidase-like protein n=1 Tax=hydrothermal vent metagenome TaxID=652676 RepID=A0A3B0SRN0_9ZZZZ
MSQLHSLKNGIRVIIDPMPSLETTALGVWAQAGSVDERDEEHGIAHLLEHMAFKGTKRRSARAIAEEIENVGGYLNAATSHQRTGYYVRLLKDDIALGVDIIADILQNPAFDEGELEKEKEVVVQEIGEAADMPDDVVFELLQEATWDGDPLSRAILGTPASVRAQNPQSLRGFMERCYRPETLIIAAAGKIDVDEFLPLVESQFADFGIEGQSPKRSAPAFKGGVRHDAREIEQTHLAVALPGVSSRDEDFFATRIFADALGGGMSSRLFQKIREERGLAYSVYAFADGYNDCGLIGAYVGADATQILEAAQLIRQEIEAMAAGASQIEIDRARAMLRSSLMMSLESPAARIESASGQMMAFGRVLAPEEITERLAAVTASDVERCAARALAGGASISLVGAGDASEVAAVF